MDDENNLTLLSIEELPETDEKKVKPRINCLQEMVIEIMNERGLRDADVVKATNIPWSTWSGWISQDVKCQLADRNLLALGKYFNVDLYYLLYGIGNDSPHFKEFEDFIDNDFKNKVTTTLTSAGK